MKQLYKPIGSLVALFLFMATNVLMSQVNPAESALGFNVFLENNAKLKTNETEGPIALGGDLTVNGNYQVNIHNEGTFEVDGVKIGLLVGGKVFYNSGILRVNQRRYVKIGVSDGSSVVWYRDPNNATPPIRITPGGFDASSAIHLQTSAPDLGVSAANNPVFQSDLINFRDSFQKMRVISDGISGCNANAEIKTANGQIIPLPHQNLPNQIKINLKDGVNYFSISGSDLSRISELTYINKPSATKLLVINVDAPGTFNWHVWNQPGIGFSDTPYVIYNFFNTTTLNITSGATVEGTVFAPFADIDKTGHQSNIQGQVIGKSLIQDGGEIHYAKFKGFLSLCQGNPPLALPVAGFNINADTQCFDGHVFNFSDTSTDAGTYFWEFGDGSTSTAMNPSKSYGTSGVYTVKLTVTNNQGSDTKTKQVTVWPKIDASIVMATVGTSPGSVLKSFTLNNAGMYASYAWILPGTVNPVHPNEQTIQISFDTAGYYELILQSVDLNGCTNETIFPIVIDSDEVSTGNGGGVESHSLGDAMTKIYIHRKKNDVPTKFQMANAKEFDKVAMSAQVGARGGQSLLNMFPISMIPGDEARVTSPTDILDYTIAKEVLSVDFIYQGKTKGVVLGILTEDRVYNHTKASCDRLRGSEILSIMPLQIRGYDFLMQAIKQKQGQVEYAISFAVGMNEIGSEYVLQSNWFVNDYVPFKSMYNFQVWSTNPDNTLKLLNDLLDNISDYAPIEQQESQRLPQSYVSKIGREKTNLILTINSLTSGKQMELLIDQSNSETNGYSQLYRPAYALPTQELRIPVGDAYEFDGVLSVEGEVMDAFYFADGNWGLDFDSQYTTITNYTVSNDPDRTYSEDELAVNRNVHVQAHSEYDYLMVYKSLLPAGLPGDFTEYKFVSFTAKGSGWLDIGLIKSSINQWKDQFKVTLDVDAEEKTYYVPFDYFTSSGSNGVMTAEDLTTLTFTFLPVEAGTNDLNLFISDVKFTKTAPKGYEASLITLKNEFVIYPNPSKGQLNCILYSDATVQGEVQFYDISGKMVRQKQIELQKGRNEIQMDVSLDSGIYLMKVRGGDSQYGTTKVIFR